MKVFRKLLSYILMISMLALMVGCGKKENNVNNEHVPHKTVEEKIGSKGGTIKESSNIKLNIPKDALKNDANISARYVDYDAEFSDKPSMNFLGGAEFGPSKTTFDKPVKVSLKLTKKPTNETLSVFYYDEENEMWDYVTSATVKDGNAEFEITHFSKYQTLDITPKVYERFHELVYEAKATKKSDAWIKDQYVNYLLNEEHIMDYYSLYGGLYYEPCGFLVAGGYHLNGVEGDPNQLVFQVGESNRIGNKYGMSHIGSLHASKQDSKTAKEKTTEKQEIIDVMVCVDYKMIKPKIDLTASTTKLKNGKSATVSIHCHYVNPNNLLYPDFDLPYYNLTLPFKLVCLKTNKSEVITNEDGKASFKVTALDLKNKSETVKVMFYEDSKFRVYADAYVTFTGEEAETTTKKKKTDKNKKGMHSFNGHISQVSEYEYYKDFHNDCQYSKGTITIKVEYDFEGEAELDTFQPLSGNEFDTYGNFKGTISISNVKVTISSTKSTYDSRLEDCEFSYYIDPRIQTNTIPTVHFTACRIADGYDPFCTYTLIEDEIESSKIGYIEANAHAHVLTYFEDYNGVISLIHTGDYDCDVDISILISSIIIPNFEFKKGTYTTTTTEMSAVLPWLSYVGHEDYHSVYWAGTYSTDTTVTQTITIN